MEFREVAGPTRKVVLYGIEAVAYAKMALQTTPEEWHCPQKGKTVIRVKKRPTSRRARQ